VIAGIAGIHDRNEIVDRRGEAVAIKQAAGHLVGDGSIDRTSIDR
jgi:hypothetical protein